MENPQIRFLQERRSCVLLQEPAPDRALLTELYAAAMRAPDHARLRPMRWIVVEGSARNRLGQILEQAAVAQNPELDEAARQRTQKLPLRAPMILIVVAGITEHPKVPEVEQLLSAGCGAYAALLGLEAAGFGGIWRTGAPAYDPHVHQELGLQPSERLVGFLYIGTPAAEEKARPVEFPAFDERVGWLPDAD